MLLYGLIEALSLRGIVMFVTSNVPPDELYKNGLQRSRFEPAIELIKHRNQVINIEGESDYRLGKVFLQHNYYSPLSQDTDLLLKQQFTMLAEGAVMQNGELLVHDRPIQSRMHASNIVWFDFKAICEGPRAAIDYLYLAANYECIIISNVYKMNESDDDVAKRFIHLVDACYDRDVSLIISATGLPQELYCGHRFIQEFQRTISRLQELRGKSLPASDQLLNSDGVSNG
jgi:cell division protein ZapE